MKINYSSMKAENGEYALFKEVGGVRHFIDDKVDPTLKAKKFVNKQKFYGKLIIVYGFGFGYHIRELLNYYHTSVIVVYDTITTPHTLANELSIIKDLIINPRLVLKLGLSEQMIVKEWDSYSNYLSGIGLESYYYNNFALYYPIVSGQDALSKEFRMKLQYILEKKDQDTHRNVHQSIDIVKILLSNQMNNLDKFNKVTTTILGIGMKTIETINYYSKESAEKQVALNAELWRFNEGETWHNNMKELYKSEGFFEKERKQTLEQIERLVINNEFQIIVEIGTGNGMFLEYLANRYKDKIESFVGLDLNDKVIMENQRYHIENVRYWSGYTEDWINLNKEIYNNVLFISIGCIYYFTQKELDSFLNLAKTSFRKTAVVISDMVDMDLSNQLDSIPRKRVIGTYSHNFSERFKHCGYSVLEQSISYLEENYGPICISGIHG